MPYRVSVRYFKTSAEIIQLAVMLYVRFRLSLGACRKNVSVSLERGAIARSLCVYINSVWSDVYLNDRKDLNEMKRLRN